MGRGGTRHEPRAPAARRRCACAVSGSGRARLIRSVIVVPRLSDAPVRRESSSDDARSLVGRNRKIHAVLSLCRSLAFSGNGHVTNVSHNISHAGLRVDGDRLAAGLLYSPPYVVLPRLAIFRKSRRASEPAKSNCLPCSPSGGCEHSSRLGSAADPLRRPPSRPPRRDDAREALRTCRHA